MNSAIEKQPAKNITIDELPEILTAKHISAHLHLSLDRVYYLFKLSPDAGGIKSFAIRRSMRAEKKDYIEWLEKMKKGSVSA